MKMLSSLLVFSLAASSVALADPNERDHRRPRPRPAPNRPDPTPVPVPRRPDPRPVPAPAPRLPLPTYPDAQGRVHSMAIYLENLATQAATYAQQVFDTGMRGDRVSDAEVDAVAQLMFVRETALQFRTAVTNEGTYADDPVQTRRAYQWLERSFQLVERNTTIMSHPELRGPNSYVEQMQQAMHSLREYARLGARLGWNLAEVVMIADELENHINYVQYLVLREADRGNERAFARQLERLQRGVEEFAREARSYGRRDNARAGLRDNFIRLQREFAQVDRRMDRLRFSYQVRDAFAQLEIVYADLEQAFRTRR